MNELNNNFIMIFVCILIIVCLVLFYTKPNNNNNDMYIKLLKKHIYHLHKNYVTLSQSFENILHGMNYIHANTTYNSTEIYNLMKQNEYMKYHYHLIPKQKDYNKSKRLSQVSKQKLNSSLRKLQTFTRI